MFAAVAGFDLLYILDPVVADINAKLSQQRIRFPHLVVGHRPLELLAQTGDGFAFEIALELSLYLLRHPIVRERLTLDGGAPCRTVRC
eukprot:3300547-Pyramimonas_sp.AAC.1